MQPRDWPADEFERHRAHLQGVAYRMLGSRSDAEDAVQETWVRARRADTTGVENPAGWLTMIVARVCLNVLRSRRARPAATLDVHVPDPIVFPDRGGDPAHEAEMADAVGLALLVVLETLTPPERLAFVLHDMFAVPFDEIAAMLDRSPEAARQLASRARRRVKTAPTTPNADRGKQRRVVDAFFAAARGGNFDALVAVLDPEVVLRTDGGAERAATTGIVHGAAEVAGQAIRFALPAASLHPVLVNGAAGVFVEVERTPIALMAFTVVDGRVAEIDIITDPTRLADLDVTG